MFHFYILLTSVGICLSFINIYDFKRNKLKLAVYFLILYISICMVSKCLKVSPLYGLNIINAIFVYRLTKKTLLTVIIPLISTVLYIAVNIFCYYIVLFLTGINIYKISSIVYLILYYLITYLIIIIVSKILNCKFMKILEDFEVLYKSKIKILILLISILSICIYFETIRQIDVSCITELEVKHSLMLSFLNFLTFLSTMSLIMLMNNQNRLKEIHEYNKKLEDMTNEIKKFRHDYKNIILSMSGYIEENDMEGLRKFFYSNIERSTKNLDLYNLSLASIGNIKYIEVKGVISSKLIEAQEKGIDIKVYIPNVIEYINFNSLDLCRILGIALDNCIEASLESENPLITLSIIDEKDLTSIIILNTYKSNIKNISELFKNGYSSKGEGRGIGLSNLKEILSNYNNAYFTIKAEGEFIQKLDIYK